LGEIVQKPTKYRKELYSSSMDLGPKYTSQNPIIPPFDFLLLYI